MYIFWNVSSLINVAFYHLFRSQASMRTAADLLSANYSNTSVSIHKNAFKDIVCEMAAMLLRAQGLM